MTSTPALADTSAMPAPICPAPITPTRSIESLTENSLTQHQAPTSMAGRARSSSVELPFLGRTGQRGRRGGRVHRGGDPVEVAGADLALVLCRGVTPLLGGELALLQLDVRGHLVAGVAVGQIEHRVVQGGEAGQRDE